MSILVVDPFPSGHKAFFISLIVKCLLERGVDVITRSENIVLQQHFKRRDVKDVNLIEPEGDDIGEVLDQVVKLTSNNAYSEVFIPFLDGCWNELLDRVEQLPCSVSGIWFHPYALDRRYFYLPGVEKRLRHRRRIHKALKAPETSTRFKKIYFLAHEAVKKLNQLNPAIQGALIEDPWERLPRFTCDEARAYFGLPLDRVIFLHIGTSDKRKGLSESILAFETVLSDSSLKRVPFFLRVGPLKGLSDEEKSKLFEMQEKGDARVVDEFVSEVDFLEYFAACSWVLVPYRKFRYSSGILSNAIAASRPVIANVYGFVSERVEEEGLGLTFSPFSSKALASSMREACSGSWDQYCSPRLSVERRNPVHFQLNEL